MRIQVTIWSKRDPKFLSQYGVVTFEDWLIHEQARFAASSIATEIRSKKIDGKTVMALFRE